MRRLAAAAALTALACSCLTPLPAHAETKPVRERFGLNLSAGYGHGIHMRDRTRGKDVGDVHLLLFVPHLRFELHDWSERERWLAGRLDLVVEPQLAINFAPETGVGGGVSGGVRYRLRADRTWSPYLIALFGVGAIDYDLESQSDGFQFWLQGGLGLRRALTGDRALTADVRLYHISNAQLREPNDGIDAIAFTLGFEYR